MHIPGRLLASALLIWAYAPAHAAWPDKPIKMVVPYAPGGSTDTIARKYGSFVQEVLKQPVVIENKPGASTNIGADQVVRAKPDGYTFLFGVDTLATNPSVGPVPPFDARKALVPVSLVTHIPGLIASNADFGGEKMSDLIAMAKKEPGKYTISSASLFLQVGLVQKYTGLNLRHIPYKGGAQAAMEAAGGQVDMVFANIPVLQTLVKSGKLRPLAITSAKRSVALPDVPTLVELGMPNAIISNWYAVFAPEGTPTDIVNRLSQVTAQFVNDPQTRADLEPMGYQLGSSTAEQLRVLLEHETKSTAGFVKENPSLIHKN
ncbi:hypothetical protein W822_03705 [Advenella kashmirensis W13003]|uniref:ABC transporter substrate-binding protein n=2 Tax=Advenella kashmirensis TaxID=310575 RepID=V8QZ39_9BURK|nr:hypothetical protein W822_03705 [Advenella kashmirensis W13003]